MSAKELASGILRLFDGRDRVNAAVLLGVIVVSSLLETAGVASIGPFLAVLSAPDAIEKSVMVSHLYKLIGAGDIRTFQIYLGVATIATVLFSNAFASLTLWLIFRFTFNQAFHLGCRLLSVYLSQPYSYFLQHNTVDLARNVYDEVPRAMSGVVMPAFHVVAKSISIAFIVALLCYIDLTVALIIVVVFGGPYFALYSYLQRRNKGVRETVNEMRAATLRLSSEALSGIKELKVLGVEDRCVQMYAGPARAVSDADAQYQIFATLPKYLLESVGFVGLVLIVLFLLLRGDPVYNALPLVAVYAFGGYRLMPALQHLYMNLHFVQYFLPSLKMLVADLATEPEKRPAQPSSGGALQLKDAVELDKVTFRYPSREREVLDAITLRFKANSVTGIVGSTGSGKSTLLDILLGLLQPSDGQVRIDGVPLDPAQLRAWQSSIGYVPQQIFLTDGTIAENIALGQFRDDIDMAKVEMAGKAAHVDEFVREFPDGYRTSVGERGIRLSGGQRQRIGIARALYRNPAVLVFDEATSALDNITELAVMDTLQGLMGQKTIILVAHRLTTLRLCDQIVLLEGGRIAAQGSYDAMLERSETFRQMNNAGLAPEQGPGQKAAAL